MVEKTVTAFRYIFAYSNICRWITNEPGGVLHAIVIHAASFTKWGRSIANDRPSFRPKQPAIGHEFRPSGTAWIFNPEVSGDKVNDAKKKSGRDEKIKPKVSHTRVCMRMPIALNRYIFYRPRSRRPRVCIHANEWWVGVSVHHRVTIFVRVVMANVRNDCLCLNGDSG